MKKLVIAALVAAVAVCGNAAALDWSMANGVLAPSPEGSAMAGRCSYYTMLVFTADQAEAVNTALSAASGVDFAALSSAAKSTSQAGKSGAFGDIVKNLSGASATLFAVVLDTQATGDAISTAKNYYLTGSVTQATYDPSGSDPATLAEFTTAQMTGSWKSTSGDVPEPTSAMLLLLGVAGLALKRKQA